MGYVGKKPTPAPLTASDVTDGIISNAKLAQDVISAETELATAPATTDEFLISDAGTLKRIDYSLIKSDPTHVLLSTTTVSSAVAAVDFTSNIDSTYDIYMVDIFGVHPSVDSSQFDLRFFQGGTIVTSSIYDSMTDNYRANNASQNFSRRENDPQIRIAPDVDTNSTASLNSRVFIYNPSDTTYNTHVSYQTSHQGQSDALFASNGGGRIESTTAVDGFRFMFDTGNIETGTFKLYGVN